MLTTSRIVDIHTHVLPNIDDGPKNVQETETLLELCRQNGIDGVICTPHYRHPYFAVNRKDLNEAFARITQFRTELNLVLGAEVRLETSLKEDIRQKSVPTLGNTNFVLVEFPSHDVSVTAIDLVHELLVMELHPIIAHPERNVAFQKKPEWLTSFFNSQLYVQITASCFYSIPKRPATETKFAWRMLQEGWVTVIASDTHNTTTRPPKLIEAYDNIAHCFSHTVVDRLIENANAIWNGMECTRIVPPRPRNRFIHWIW